MLNRTDIDTLCLEGESNHLDYKSEQYRFEREQSDEAKCELLKDVLAFANANRAIPAYILIGVEESENKTGRIVGIANADVLDDAHVQQFINSKTNRLIPFRLYTVSLDDATCVQVIEINARRDERPFYSKKTIGGVFANNVYMRVGSSTLVAMPEQIKDMGVNEAEGKARPVVELPDGVEIESDWSAVVVENAKMDDLDEAAIAKAREGYAIRHSDRVTSEEVASWSVEMFLGKLRLLVDGKLTRAALLLLGRSESVNKLNPHPAEFTWKLAGGDKVYQHFSIPFILTTFDLYAKIRNYGVSFLPQNSMTAIEVPKYTQRVVLEALHNCIAHQDYAKNGRIVVTEHEDRLTFESSGRFFEGKPDDYIDGEHTPRAYRNRLLTSAMAEIRMIDTMGFGIHWMADEQRKRYMPMSDYELGDNHVRLTVYGAFIDENYTRILHSNPQLPLVAVYALDKIQKGNSLHDEDLKLLRNLGLVAGNRGAVKIVGVRNNTKDNIALLKYRILEIIGEESEIGRSAIEDRLRGVFVDSIPDDEFKAKLNYVMTSLVKAKLIHNIGTKKDSHWVLS